MSKVETLSVRDAVQRVLVMAMLLVMQHGTQPRVEPLAIGRVKAQVTPPRRETWAARRRLGGRPLAK